MEYHFDLIEKINDSNRKITYDKLIKREVNYALTVYATYILLNFSAKSIVKDDIKIDYMYWLCLTMA
ncbi:MAG: hypothetical protein PHX40_02770 [Bacilli bacterium]|nr:hypothetical protein [Bacilli bacterium]